MPGCSSKNRSSRLGAGVQVVAVQPGQPRAARARADLVEGAVGAAVGVPHHDLGRTTAPARSASARDLAGDQLRLVVQQRRQRVHVDRPAAPRRRSRPPAGRARRRRSARSARRRRLRRRAARRTVVEVGAVGELDIGHLLQQRRRARRARARTAAPSSRPRRRRCRRRRCAAPAASAPGRSGRPRPGRGSCRTSPASSTCWTSRCSRPSCSSSSVQPVEIAALANCSSRTSRWERYDALGRVGVGRRAGAARRPAPRRSWSSRSASAGRDLARRPRRGRTGRRRRAARPAPARRPRRPGRSRTARAARRRRSRRARRGVVGRGSTLTTSIAPSAARMPQRIAPPSNAGPAGAAVDRMRVAVAEHDLAVGADVDEQPGPLVAVHARWRACPATMSPPTYAPSAGNSDGAGARVQRQAEVGGEHRRAAAAVDITNGATPERLGVDAERERGHRRVAGERHLVDVRRVDAALARRPARPARPASRAAACLQPAERVAGPSSSR